MRKAALRLTCFVALLSLTLAFASADCYVTILHFNDLHGYLQPVETQEQSVGGLARIATAAAAVRAWNDAHGNDTLLFEAGDILQGTPLSMVYKGEPDVKALNLMDLDAMCVGNHEFDFGQDNLRHLVSLAQYPILSANIYVEQTGQRLVRPYVLFTLADGTRGAAFGLTSPDTAVETLPKNVAGLRFADPVEECRSILADLRAQADFLVAVTHIGYENDLRLAETFPELDVIIGAHSHTRVEPPTRVGKTLVCQAESYGRYLGQLDMRVSGGDVVKYRGFLRPINGRIAADSRAQAVVDEYASRLQERLGEVVAHTTVALDGERDNVRSRETNLGNLVADLYREYTRADVALVNAGSIRASIPAGPITVGDVLKVVPFSNLIAAKPVTGAQLRRTLERAAGLERPAGGFLQVSGLTMVIEGNALKDVSVGGEPLDEGRTYSLATSEFLLAGGDGYSMLAEGAEPAYLGFTDNAVVLDRLRERGTVSPQVEGRITFR
jgi:5'-nucleotidase/UDP-sugar diphosphatase